MKRNLIILFLLSTMSFGNNTSAQNNIKHTIKEKMVAGTTYVIEQYNSGPAIIKNKNGKARQLIKENKKQCEGIFIDNDNQEFDQARKDVVKSVFSVARINQLSKDGKNNFRVYCICNRVGEIKAVLYFLGVNTSEITIQEIKSLEDKYLKLQIKTNKTACPETEYFQFLFNVRFNVYI